MITAHPSFEQTDHRPWPLPVENWHWRQTWKDLAFMHWEADVDELRSRIPDVLDIDLFDGKAWIGIVPFDMKGVTLRGFPAPSLLCDFPEINVRTYVTHEGKSGVWFFSLDVPNPFAVYTARKLFHLPYYRADIQIDIQGDSYTYSHKRGQKTFDATYRPTGRKEHHKDSFETWSTERYCLYSSNRAGEVCRSEVHHKKWPLESADIEIRKNTLVDGLTLGKQHPSALFSKSIDVVVYPMKKLAQQAGGTGEKKPDAARR